MKISNIVSATLLALATVGGGAASAEIVSIDFDDGVAGSAVGDSYAGLGVTFANTNFTDNFGILGSSGGLAINSSTSGNFFGPDAPLIATFSVLVDRVTIRALDPGFADVRLEAYDATNKLIAFDQYLDGGSIMREFRDLTVSGAGIASFRVFQPETVKGSNRYGDGAFFDNLSFNKVGAAVPEPATWGMMILGFAAIGAAMRGRRGVAARA
jgi:hypothetical protein